MIKKLKKIISQYKLFIFLAALVPVLGFILVWQQLKPKTPPPNPVFGSLPQPESQFEIKTQPEINYQISFSQDFFSKLPTQLNVYQIKAISDQEVVNKFAEIASELDFLTKPSIQGTGETTFFVWQEEEKFLKVNSRTGQFVFQGKTPLTIGSVTPQEAESLVKEKLSQWDLLDQEAPTRITYFGVAGLELEPITNPNLADIYEVVFLSSVDDYPLVGFGPAENLAQAQVTKEGQLISLEYLFHQISQEKVGTYPVKPGQQVLAEIQQGQGKIFRLKTEVGVETNLDPQNPIKAIDLNFVKLVYYESVEKQEYLQPIYFFSGSAVLENDEVLEVSLYLPAISSEWLISTSPTPTSGFSVE